MGVNSSTLSPYEIRLGMVKKLNSVRLIPMDFGPDLLYKDLDKCIRNFFKIINL